MNGVPKYEKIGKINIIRFYTPEHKNSFSGQLISYLYFGISALNYSYTKRKDYDCIFATSSRLGTGFLGYIVSKLTKKKLNLDIRDFLSDNIQSLNFFKGYIGQKIISIFKSIEERIIEHAKWINFVSPGFFTYKHIKKLNKDIHLFTNGVDKIFVANRQSIIKSNQIKSFDKPITITYAGNIGFGQGLELIVLPLANHYKGKIKIQLIGDGSSVKLIQDGIVKEDIDNIQFIPPVNRLKLLDYYNRADIFLLQLNDIPAFEKVLPSKIFDYGSFDKPILAGVKGVANTFISEHLPYAHLFDPGDINSVIKYLDFIFDEGFPIINNDTFIEKYSRNNIMRNMLESIILHNFNNKLG